MLRKELEAPPPPQKKEKMGNHKRKVKKSTPAGVPLGKIKSP